MTGNTVTTEKNGVTKNERIIGENDIPDEVYARITHVECRGSSVGCFLKQNGSMHICRITKGSIEDAKAQITIHGYTVRELDGVEKSVSLFGRCHGRELHKAEPKMNEPLEVDTIDEYIIVASSLVVDRFNAALRDEVSTVLENHIAARDRGQIRQLLAAGHADEAAKRLISMLRRKKSTRKHINRVSSRLGDLRVARGRCLRI